MSLRLGWWSNAPWQPTGYGQQTAVWTPQLRELGHDVVIIANWGLEGAPLEWRGMKVLPRAWGSLGMDIVAAHAKFYKLDAVIMLGDLWPLVPFDMDSVRLVPWFPVDTEPLAEPIAELARRSFMPIAYSRFGVEMCRAAGVDVQYVPHGIDCETYCPGDKSEARAHLSLPDDSFIVTMVAANKGYPSRKAFPAQIEAFSRLKRQHSDALLYLHTLPGTGHEFEGVDLVRLCGDVGLRVGKDVLFTPEYLLWTGVAESEMAQLYRASDVLLSVSMAEGFGLPIVEAQACGCPVIVGNWTSMDELCFAGWKVEKDKADPFWVPTGAYQFQPRVGAIHDRLRDAYKHARDAGMAERARAGAMRYDVNVVRDGYWVPVLAELERRLSGTRVVKAA